MRRRRSRRDRDHRTPRKARTPRCDAGARPHQRQNGDRRHRAERRHDADVAIGEASPSPAGPAPQDGGPIALPPAIPLPRPLQTLRFSMRQIDFVFRARRECGEVFRMRGMIGDRDEVVVVTSHPDHVRSLFTAKSEDAPSLTGESPLRVGGAVKLQTAVIGGQQPWQGAGITGSQMDAQVVDLADGVMR